jgi:hypothetical protein
MQATNELALRKQFEVFAGSMFSSRLNYIVCRSEIQTTGWRVHLLAGGHETVR